MTKASYWITGALVLTMGTAGIAHARGYASDGQQGAGMQQMFEKFDTDSDGKITQAEIDAAKAARFAAADSDGDGFLSAEEMTAYADQMRAERETQRRAARTEAMVKSLDKDGDGKLSAEEATAGGPGQMMLQRLDADKDGAVSLEELLEARGMMGKRGDRDGRGGGKYARGHDHGAERGHDRGGNGDRAPWWMR
ncbi:EF-hand domain-containing protein [Tropicibacter oceani]|uniref:EF-hand domain-containing protein n=1 Tax=Tropicibacter oceani TaxID=3058420 RepID=A0ABY8QLU0_9RHOB|nr:EF-hand domain-containing protein [Tropicibacter oceani]WGW05599.1 EF-hand domain-containing protein [Tropicibacter oceani]